MSSFQVFDANAERQSPTFTDFTHTFVLTDTEQTLSEIPKALALNISRKRRVHKKSRRGCENCRRRRVKCNEGNPYSAIFSRRKYHGEPAPHETISPFRVIHS
ncbi:hypothetical protein V2G26_013073 [Clonostachys chloroleuca]